MHGGRNDFVVVVVGHRFRSVQPKKLVTDTN